VTEPHIPVEELQKIQVPHDHHNGKALLDHLIGHKGNLKADTQRLVELLLASHLEVLDVLGKATPDSGKS
jgi:hypothetical protein